MDYCCEAMRRAIDGWREGCGIHEHAHECPDALISVFSRGYHGIIVHDGGSSHIDITYCPWCGIWIGDPTVGVGLEGTVKAIKRMLPAVSLTQLEKYDGRVIYAFWHLLSHREGNIEESQSDPGRN